ncbi:MAG: LEA type 2 family protein [Flavobacteriales bacterium]
MNFQSNIKRSSLMVLVVFLFFISSCTIYKDVEVKEVLDVNISEFSMDAVTGDVQISITNPNWYKVTLKDCHIDFMFEGKPLGSAELLDDVVIPKKTTSTQTFTIKADPEQLKAIMGNAIILLFKSEYVLEGTGYVKGKALGVSKSFPVAFKETLTKEDLGF